MNYADILVVSKKLEIEAVVEQHLLYNSSRHSNLKIYDIEFDSYEEVEEYLSGLRNDTAVKFREYELKNKTQQQVNLENKALEIRRKLNQPISKQEVKKLREKLPALDSKIQQLEIKRRKKKFTIKWAVKVVF